MGTNGYYKGIYPLGLMGNGYWVYIYTHYPSP